MVLESSVDVWVGQDGVEPATRHATDGLTETGGVAGIPGPDQVGEDDDCRVGVQLAQAQHSAEPRQHEPGQRHSRVQLDPPSSTMDFHL